MGKWKLQTSVAGKFDALVILDRRGGRNGMPFRLFGELLALPGGRWAIVEGGCCADGRRRPEALSEGQREIVLAEAARAEAAGDLCLAHARRAQLRREPDQIAAQAWHVEWLRGRPARLRAKVGGDA